jgi:undecaprenyl-diphosphatase
VELLEAAIFGILQGLTEFLPVSSSGHLAVFNKLFGFASEGELLFQVVAVHVATLLAVVIVFWRDILSLFGTNKKVIALLIVGTVPAAVFGLLAKDFFEDAGGNMVLVGTGFLASALFLLGAGRRARGEKDLGKLTLADSLVVGFAQALAILPGVSRSGSTISVAQYRGADNPSAARFSFLLMIPAVGGAALLEAREILSGGTACEPASTAVSFVCAFVVAVFALKLLLRLLKKGRLSIFSYYLIPLGLVSVLYGLLA